MKILLTVSILLCVCMSCEDKKAPENKENIPFGPITLVIHGGAGTILRENMSPEKERLYHEALKQALQSGFDVLKSGGTSTEAVIASIKVMEDSPLFNAGKGAVFTNEGKNELDASIMEGQNLKAGAVAGVTIVKNPITAAHSVMTKSQHVMLSGAGAELFAKEQGLDIVDPSYFFDSARFESLQKAKAKETSHLENQHDPFIRDRKFGTVGAVALDRFGNLAAGTSTGGMTNKKWGRIGDSPIIGAGTYANNKTCAVSATGHGEYFIRLAVANTISAMMEFANASVQDAADEIINKRLSNLGGEGGVIVLDRKGNFTMTFNSAGMYRGFINQDGEAKTFIYKD